jgi:phenylalanyl-tRNA synthetase beta chain
MKVSELWLHEWVKPTLSREELGERMTMAGLEIESLTPVAEFFSHVVVGKILKIETHPEADRLTLCEVDIGAEKPAIIVCGAQNVKVGINVPAALPGAVLPNNLKITTSTIRGITSHGMLCSARELSLAEESDGLFILPADAKMGDAVWEYLKLSDYIIDVSITPNRGDCLSIMGLAKEISALTKTEVTLPAIPTQSSTIPDALKINITASEACPHYVGRIIRNVKADAITPIWMQERLRRTGVRCISPVVDVMNYVMLELGQPMHAFDLSKIDGNIHVRMAKTTEQLELLDGQTATLTDETLIIADDKKPLAIAGVMGGLQSAVTLLTKDIFLESAYFNPKAVAKTGRHFNLGSESSYRYERGVDPTLQATAIERATQLLLELVGGEAGPVVEITEKSHFPKQSIINLRAARIEKILGMKISAADVETILTALHFICEKTNDGWKVTVPYARADVTLEVDLIEEVMRLYGSNRVPLRDSYSALRMLPNPENHINLVALRNTLRDLGYQEVVTYTFVDSKLQQLLNPDKEPKPLVNPITSDMNVMRTNLWPGLIKTLMYNANRQQNRVRIFETGLRFVSHQHNFLQERVLGGLINGSAYPEQWGVPTRAVDFFDLKGDLQSLFKLTFASDEFTFKKAEHAALHPGQTAEIYRNDQYVGIMGSLHPIIVQNLDLQSPVFVFELLLERLEIAQLPRFNEISKFPEIRRDIAIFVDRSVPLQMIQDTIREKAGELLQDINLFDVYQGQHVGVDRKSLALSLTLQHSSRTLVDEEVTDLMDRVIGALKERFAAELRG